MNVGDKYKVQYFDEWIDVTVTSDPSVKELFFITDSGEFIFQHEIDKKILLTD